MMTECRHGGIMLPRYLTNIIKISVTIKPQHKVNTTASVLRLLTVVHSQKLHLPRSAASEPYILLVIDLSDLQRSLGSYILSTLTCLQHSQMLLYPLHSYLPIALLDTAISLHSYLPIALLDAAISSPLLPAYSTLRCCYIPPLLPAYSTLRCCYIPSTLTCLQHSQMLLYPSTLTCLQHSQMLLYPSHSYLPIALLDAAISSPLLPAYSTLRCRYIPPLLPAYSTLRCCYIPSTLTCLQHSQMLLYPSTLTCLQHSQMLLYPLHSYLPIALLDAAISSPLLPAYSTLRCCYIPPLLPAYSTLRCCYIPPLLPAYSTLRCCYIPSTLTCLQLSQMLL